MSATFADRVRQRDSAAIQQLKGAILPVVPGNLVERPWGGHRLLELKGDGSRAVQPYGESFEVSADPDDAESRVHPSMIRFDDGSPMILSDLFRHATFATLGPEHERAFGARYPLLPKLLHIRERLSVQTHPPGQPEAYFVLEADPGATIQLGFRFAMSGHELAARLQEGRDRQEKIQSLLSPDIPVPHLLALVRRYFADRKAPLVGWLEWLRESGGEADLAVHLSGLADVHGEMTEGMNTLSVKPGDVILNATVGPEPRDAEVHALGNDDGLEMLLLEIRRTGTTLRLWDNGRFPARPLHIQQAIEAVSTEPREPSSFFVERASFDTLDPLQRRVECHAFVAEELGEVSFPYTPPPLSAPHTIHATRGSCRLEGRNGTVDLGYGSSAFVCAGATYRVLPDSTSSKVVRAWLPEQTKL